MRTLYKSSRIINGHSTKRQQERVWLGNSIERRIELASAQARLRQMQFEDIRVYRVISNVIDYEDQLLSIIIN